MVSRDAWNKAMVRRTCFLGLLCITCTDLAVLATTNYPEKWYPILLSSSSPGVLTQGLATRTTAVFRSKRNIAMKPFVPVFCLNLAHHLNARITGSTFGFEHCVDVRRKIWPLYRTNTVPFDRFLRAHFCSGKIRPSGSQKGCIVSVSL